MRFSSEMSFVGHNKKTTILLSLQNFQDKAFSAGFQQSSKCLGETKIACIQNIPRLSTFVKIVFRIETSEQTSLGIIEAENTSSRKSKN